MSLRAWFPLNGDLHNQGLDTVTLTMPNATFTNDGKLGKCLSLPGAPTDNFSVPSMAGKKQMSIAYWVRVNEIISNNWLDGISWYSTNGSSNKYNRQEFYYMKSDTNKTTTGIWYDGGNNSGYTHSVGEWHHYVIMIDYSSGYCWFYIDGVLKGTETNVNTTHYLKGTNFKLGDSTINISECEVRIYDHILSVKEIKELSKGLVAHYSLSGPLDSNDNTIYDCSGYNYHGVSTSTTISSDSARYSSSTIFDGINSYLEFNNLSFMPTMLPLEWSFSFWIYNQDSGNRSVIFSNYKLGTAGNASFGFEKTTSELLRIAYVNGTFDKTIPNSTMTVNAWTHFVITKTTAHLITVYRNGVQIDSYTNDNCASDGIVYRMGSDKRADNTRLEGKLSDFRIYSTVLTAEDVQALYNAPISVAKPGTLLTQSEFVEASAASFRKTGVITIDGEPENENDTVYGFNENDGNVSISSGSIKAEDFIEY